MPSNQFQFKKFTILQNRCAMKVGTDGVLLGAWTNTNNTQKILDIGTGTGLIALMLAQRSQAIIDAVEIDQDSAIQARENVENSPWKDRIKIHHAAIQDYENYAQKQYNLIVSNPPFFENASKSSRPARTRARHTDYLSQADLLQITEQLLDSAGRLAVIYPCEEAEKFQKKAENFGLFCHRKLSVQPNQNRPLKRILMEFSPHKLPTQESAIAIESSRHVYTPEFITLIQDFYLKY